MWNCGLDGHEESMTLCVVDKSGARRLEETLPVAGTDMEAILGPFARKGLRVALEASGGSFALYDRLTALGCDEVLVWPPHKLRVIAESKAKNDRNDSRWLAELLRLGFYPRSVYIPTPREREIRDFLTTRNTVLRSRIRISQSGRSMMVRLGMRAPSRAFQSHRGWRRICADPLLSGANRLVLEEMYTTWKGLYESENRLNSALEEIAEKDERVRWLRSIPGVGLLSSLWFLVGLGNPERFRNSREVASYLGLVPTMSDSADTRVRGHITKEGKAELRAVWIQAAHCFLLSRASRNLPLRTWFDRCAKKRGRRVAVVGLARKLMIVAWHLLKEKRGFQREAPMN